MTWKKSEKEEEYAARMEFERKKKMEAAEYAILAEGEKEKLKQLCHMRCPKCGMELIEVGYRGDKGGQMLWM